jgi:Skp family chaperone for outer membrane proteins
MKILTTAIVFGPLMLIGASVAAAGQSSVAFGAGAPVQLAAGGSSAADRDTYSQKAQDEVREWQRKLHDLGDKAEAKGKEADNAAESDLDGAWTRTQAESRKLQAAGAEDWENTKASFEKASHDLAEAWHKIHPDDK